MLLNLVTAYSSHRTVVKMKSLAFSFFRSFTFTIEFHIEIMTVDFLKSDSGCTRSMK